MYNLQFLFIYDKLIRLHLENNNLFDWETIPTLPLKLQGINPIKFEKRAKEYLIKKDLIEISPSSDSISELTLKGITFSGFLTEALREESTEYPRVIRVFKSLPETYYSKPLDEDIVFDKLVDLHFARKYHGFIIKTYYEPLHEDFNSDEKIIDNCFTYMLNHKDQTFRIDNILAFVGVTAFNKKREYYALKLLESGLVSKLQGYGDDNYRIKLNAEGIISLTEHIRYSDYIKAKNTHIPITQTINNTSHGANSPIVGRDFSAGDFITSGSGSRVNKSSESSSSKSTLYWTAAGVIVAIIGVMVAYLLVHKKI